MDNKYLEAINQVFEQEGSLSKEKLTSLMNVTLEYFQEIQARITSEDPAAQEQALKETLEIQALLEEKIQTLSKKTGVDRNQLLALAANLDFMTADEKETISTAKEKLDKLTHENI